MTESEQLLARIDERTENMEKTLDRMDKCIDELYNSRNELKSRMDKLETEHRERTDCGGGSSRKRDILTGATAPGAVLVYLAFKAVMAHFGINIF